MFNLFHHLPSSLPVPSFETALHVGAGASFSIQDYVSRPPKRIILVEGDPEAAAELLGAANGHPNVEVIETVVTSTEVVTPFYRYNFSFLNGPLAPGKLAVIYPRLRVEGQLVLPGHTFASLLDRLAIPHHHANLLVLDVPGQEHDLLTGIAPEFLHAFDWILLRASQEALQEGARPADAVVQYLQTSCYDIIVSDSESDPAWPVQLLHRDRNLVERNETSLRIHKLETLKDDLAKLAADRQAQLDAAAKARDEQAKLAAYLRAQLDAAAKERDEQSKLAADRQTQLDSAAKERDEQSKLAADRQTQLDSAAKARDEQSNLAADRQAQLDAAAKARDEQTKSAAYLRAQLDAAARARDEQSNLAADLQTQLDAAAKARDEHAKLAADRQAQLDAAATARDEHAKLAADRQTQLDAAAKARDENANQLQKRAAECELLKKTVNERAGRISDLEMQLAEQAQKQRLMEEEILKAETQLEMLKEFLRPSLA